MLPRDYRASDARAVDRLALAAFEQFSSDYADWPTMAAAIGRMSELAEHGEIIIAECDGMLVGAVAYIPPHRPKADCFRPEWPVVRMLVVDPAARGRGIGRALAEECVRRARRDAAPVIALHTSPVMTVALPLYLRMGFEWLRDAPPIHGVPYAVYLKRLDA